MESAAACCPVFSAAPPSPITRGRAAREARIDIDALPISDGRATGGSVSSRLKQTATAAWVYFWLSGRVNLTALQMDWIVSYLKEWTAKAPRADAPESGAARTPARKGAE